MNTNAVSRWIQGVLPAMFLLTLLPLHAAECIRSWDEFEKIRATSRAPAGLTLTISTDSKEFFVGERIPVTFTYTNMSTQPVHVETSTYDRSGRLNNMKWFALGPGGKPAPDPLEGMLAGRMGGGISPLPRQIVNGESYVERFDANEWLWLGEPGQYEVAVASMRVGNVWGLCSNRMKVSIRAPREGEVDSLVEQCTKRIDAEPDPKGRRSHSQEYEDAVSALRFLHSERAIPAYLKYCQYEPLKSTMQMGLYGIPNTDASLPAFRESLRGEDIRISKGLYVRLYSKAHGLPLSPWDELDTPDEVTSDLMKIVRQSTGTERLFGILAVDPSGLSKVEAQRLLEQLPRLTRSQQDQVLSGRLWRAFPELIRFSERYLDGRDSYMRVQVMASLLNTGEPRYASMYIDDLLSSTPRFGKRRSGGALSLSEELQLKIAHGLNRVGANRATELVSLFRGNTALASTASHFKDAYDRFRDDEFLAGRLLDLWSQADPDGARQEVLDRLRKTPRVVGQDVLKRYGREPEVQRRLLDSVTTNPAVGMVPHFSGSASDSALEILGDLGTTEAIPAILERARRNTSHPRPFNEAMALGKITGHLLFLAPDASVEEDRAAFAEWAKWWDEHKGLPPERLREANTRHAIDLLGRTTDTLWMQADARLRELTGEDAAKLTTDTMRLFHTMEPSEQERLRLEAHRAWETWWQQHGGRSGISNP